ncbi:MAG: SusC/RagA family TonB-linked outer membrane protein, partial [Cyclobacteriaceae bacterium]|nr:SusC/RagA family TonB-linked outer membrane protein [Cyclobacteriaceae bacterium]
LNFSKSKSKVIELPAKVSEWYNSDTWLIGAARGSAYPENLQDYYNSTDYPFYNWDYHQRGMGSGTAIGGTGYQRNTNGDILINPSTGLPYITSDYLPIGERNPDFMIGLTNSVKYKNFNISFLFDIRRGGDVLNGNEYYLYTRGLSTRNLDRENLVIMEGVLKDGLEYTANPTKNNISLLPYTMGATFYQAMAMEDFVEKDINWLRLRDITLAYVFPADVISKIKPISSVSLFSTMNDLFMITNYTGADPMVNGTTPATSGMGAFGFDYGSISLPKSITFGIRVSL